MDRNSFPFDPRDIKFIMSCQSHSSPRGPFSAFDLSLVHISFLEFSLVPYYVK